jgi:hypothetical protein
MTTTYRKDDLNQAFYALQLLSEHVTELRDMDPAIRELMTNSHEREKIRLSAGEHARDKLINETIALITQTFAEAKKSIEASGNMSLLQHHPESKQSPEQIASALQDNPKRLAEMAEIVYRLATASKGSADDTAHFIPPRTVPQLSIERIGHALLPNPAFKVVKYEAGKSKLPELQKEHYRLMLNFVEGSNELATHVLARKLKAALNDYASINNGNKSGVPFISISPLGEKFKDHELFAMADRAELASTFQYYRSASPGTDDGGKSTISRNR